MENDDKASHPTFQYSNSQVQQQQQLPPIQPQPQHPHPHVQQQQHLSHLQPQPHNIQALEQHIQPLGIANMPTNNNMMALPRLNPQHLLPNPGQQQLQQQQRILYSPLAHYNSVPGFKPTTHHPSSTATSRTHSVPTSPTAANMHPIYATTTSLNASPRLLISPNNTHTNQHMINMNNMNNSINSNDILPAVNLSPNHHHHNNNQVQSLPAVIHIGHTNNNMNNNMNNNLQMYNLNTPPILPTITSAGPHSRFHSPISSSTATSPVRAHASLPVPVPIPIAVSSTLTQQPKIASATKTTSTKQTKQPRKKRAVMQEKKKSRHHKLFELEREKKRYLENEQEILMDMYAELTRQVQNHRVRNHLLLDAIAQIDT